MVKFISDWYIWGQKTATNYYVFVVCETQAMKTLFNGTFGSKQKKSKI